MKCLSLWQPWASLLVHGKKRVETRSWGIRHRGPLLIHAAKTWNGELQRICGSQEFATAVLECGAKTTTDLPLGAIVGRVDVVDCYPAEKVHHSGAADGVMICPTYPNWLMIGPTEKAFGDYSPGRFAFLCSSFVAFAKPIPYRGMQGLFDVPDIELEKAGA